MMLEKEFNTYIANLSVLSIKLHNIHWNVEGSLFPSVHSFTESEYDLAFERMDEVAEHCKMFGYIPVSTMKEHLALATIVEEDSRKFNCTEALEIVKKDLEAMRDEAIALRAACDEQNWFSAVSLLEDHITDYNKKIWFLNATLAK